MSKPEPVPVDPRPYRARMAMPTKSDVLKNCKTARVKERVDGKYTITVDSHRDVEALREMTQESREVRLGREVRRSRKRTPGRRRRINLDEYDPSRPLRSALEIWEDERNANNGS